jgi:hypothetical protein
MSQANRFFNGSKLFVNGSSTAVTNVVGLAYKDGGSWIDVTVPEDLVKIYQLSTQDDVSLQIKYKGAMSLTRGEILTALSITWADTSTSTISDQQWQVGPIDKTGDWDAPVTGTVEVRPTVPTAS